MVTSTTLLDWATASRYPGLRSIPGFFVMRMMGYPSSPSLLSV